MTHVGPLVGVGFSWGRRLMRLALVKAIGPFDLTALDKIPQRLTWPLERAGFDPIPRVGQLRSRAPVARLTTFGGITVWVVTGQAEARRVMADTTSYSNDIRPLVGSGNLATGGYIGGLGFTDPPEHTRLRRYLTPEFTRRRLQRLVPVIEGIVDNQLDVLRRALDGETGCADLMRDFAFPIPFLVICELLGLPDQDRDRFAAMTSARFDISAGGAGAFGAISGSREFLLDFVKTQRQAPGRGLVGQILREHGDEISDIDVAGLADGVFTGGLETSASMLALGALVLFEHPDTFHALARAEAAEVERVVDELLRYLSVVQIAFPRFAKVEHTIGEIVIGAGDVVIAHLAAANRDPRAGFGDGFDPRCPAAAANLAFGHGFHRCVGAELAKLELRIAYPALARSMPDLRATVPGPEFRKTSLVYGADQVFVTRS